ncbi:hypothetical protein [Azotobacter beijerinckii]|uniref:Glutamate 5-kinase n=1 Tax=Azotobacter beijerinckii TaxID=170623 RepID=A0A1I0Z0C7_9GAMM|nr:hypothetical protein [Azotobacter beijerinckii]SFB19149.1 hypothetical protein SAMN04244571_01723 [Azotobacter beijerinckii]
MGLRDDITADLAEAFDTDLGDAVTAFTAEHPGPAAYDPATGTMTTTVTAYSGRGVLGSYRSDQIDGTLILATDQELTALQAEVTRSPAVGDTIAGMKVVRVEQDPASVTWTIQLRA